jgi:hypothetical protein
MKVDWVDYSNYGYNEEGYRVVRFHRGNKQVEYVTNERKDCSG